MLFAFSLAQTLKTVRVGGQGWTTSYCARQRNSLVYKLPLKPKYVIYTHLYTLVFVHDTVYKQRQCMLLISEL